MNEQFETQNPVENTVTPANQMETPTPEAPKKTVFPCIRMSIHSKWIFP